MKQVADGVAALPGGLLYLGRTRSLIASDLHLGIESSLGLAVPSWSVQIAVERVADAARRLPVSEIVLLGDAVDAANEIASAGLRTLRAIVPELVWIRGNHEARVAKALRNSDITLLRWVRRDGWLLSHGDRAEAPAKIRRIIGHLHPSIGFEDYAARSPCLLAGERMVVAPALSPYSTGLDVLDADGREVLRRYGIPDATVFAISDVDVRRVGTLRRLWETVSTASKRDDLKRLRSRLL